MDQPPLFSNVLIRVPNWLGDNLMATPVVSAVREMLPEAKVTVLCKSPFSDFWKTLYGVDQVVIIENGFLGFWKTVQGLKKQKFDAALILPGSLSSAFLIFAAEIPWRAGWGGEGRELFLTHVVERLRPREKHLVWEYLALASHGLKGKITSDRFRLSSSLSLNDRAEAQKILKAGGINQGKGLVALGPGATYGPAKRWPLPYWRQLVRQLLKTRPESILIIGGKEESEYLERLSEGLSKAESARVLSLVGKTPLRLLAAFLKDSKVLITNDTGPMHMAAAVGTPAVALFGSTSPVWTRPFGIGHEVIYKRVECSPCFQKTCPIGYVCLHQISVEEVYQAALQKIKSAGVVQGEKPPRGVLV